MERLTYNGDYCFMSCYEREGDLVGEECLLYKNCFSRQMFERLQHYEDLEEQGRLITLPCLPDEIVYAAHEDCRTVKVAYASIEHILADLEAGWCIGYTKEEALAKLKELKGE